MKTAFFLVLLPLLTLAIPAFAGEQLGGVFFVCSNDPDQERHFLGMSGHNAMQDEARKAGNEFCDNLSGGVATHIVYIYKDGSQIEDGK